MTLHPNPPFETLFWFGERHQRRGQKEIISYEKGYPDFGGIAFCSSILIVTLAGDDQQILLRVKIV
ncbi:MAG: hypothetical protein II513_06755, partial [Ruminococcus sp.]|nr:hypothetical protein [Ruminococcus sp.]